MSKTAARARSIFCWLGGIVLIAGLAIGVAAAQPAPQPAGKKPAKKPAARNPAAKPASGKKATSGRSRGKKVASRKSSRRSRRSAWRRRGQQSIDEQRIRQIQEALVREQYLTSEPTGAWDDRSRQAMMKYQQDNGWQTKVLPDSRALIKLGLGPSYAGVINPESLPASEDRAPSMLPAAGVVTKPQP